MHILYPFARRFIAGEDMLTAVKNIDSLYNSGYLSTVDILGEHVHSEEDAAKAKLEYLNILDSIKTRYPIDLSVKVSQMGLDIDASLCEKNIEEIILNAGTHTVRLDMEGSDYTQRTIDIGLKLHQKHKKPGIVLQACLFRTADDVETLIDKGVSVRICKGAYNEPPEIAWQNMDQVRESFLKSAYSMLKCGCLPSIATHDEYLIGKIIQFVKDEKIPAESFYFELLYGVRRDLQKILLDKGYQVRIYVPYGKSWLPYTLRRLAERKENILFVIKNMVLETLGIRKIH